jgi:hypothetical protein
MLLPGFINIYSVAEVLLQNNETYRRVQKSPLFEPGTYVDGIRSGIINMAGVFSCYNKKFLEELIAFFPLT